jgi:hypothetical protein
MESGRYMATVVAGRLDREVRIGTRHTVQAMDLMR